MIVLDTAEQKRQKDLERLRSFRPMDDDFMRCLFKDNPYDPEIQRVDKGTDPHQARFHSGVMDIENLDAGIFRCRCMEKQLIN